MTRERVFSQLLKEISSDRKKIEGILRKALGRRKDRRSLTAIAVLTPSTLKLPDLPFPENIKDYLSEGDYTIVKVLWERLKGKMEEIFSGFDDILESYRRQVFTHYLRKLQSFGTITLTDEQRQDLYQSLNLGICKALLCYDHRKEKENPAKFFLKVMRGVLRTYLSGEVLGISVPPTQYQKKVMKGEEIPLVVTVSQIIPEAAEEENNNNEPLDLTPLTEDLSYDWFTEIEVRDIINRLPSVFKETLVRYLDGEDDGFPLDVRAVILSVSVLTVMSLLKD
ncbi:MAG: hypothetical protein QW687_00205 [Candidatus Hadarchaeales archaeon]